MIDLPQLRYTIMLNGVTQICITKIDVLNIFKELQAATAYKLDGAESTDLPYDMAEVKVEPVYQKVEGWNTTLDGITDFDALPETAKSYIDFLEKYLKTKVTMISTGPEREKIDFTIVIDPRINEFYELNESEDCIKTYDSFNS